LVRDKARQLQDSGLSIKAVAEQLGVDRETVMRWNDPTAAKRWQKRQKEWHRRRREALAALSEVDRQKARSVAAKKAGGSIAAAYSTVRVHLEALDAAILEADDRDLQATLRAARDLIHKAEDKIAEALRVS
jgi:transposase